MIDKQSVLERTDLLSLVGGSLRRVSTTNGGEYAGPCPVCGGEDRFRVQPNKKPHGVWFCRHCTEGKWQNAIDYLIWRDGLDFKAALTQLAGGKVLAMVRRNQAPPPVPAYGPPDQEWQSCAREAIEFCHTNLFRLAGDKALDYLLDRGLSEGTMMRFLLGYSPGLKFGELYVPEGVVIPCLAGDDVWYLKVALLPGQRVRCEGSQRDNPHYCLTRRPCPTCGTVNKYRGVKGNRTNAIFNADDLVGARDALIVEGEFDAMVGAQELSRELAVCTFGSAGNKPDLATWGRYLIGLENIYAAYDTDEAGQDGAKKTQGLSSRVQVVALPGKAKDLNDLFLSGGDLWKWIKPSVKIELRDAEDISDIKRRI